MDLLDLHELFRVADETPGIRSAWMLIAETEPRGLSLTARELLCPGGLEARRGEGDELEYERFWAFAAHVPHPSRFV